MAVRYRHHGVCLVRSTTDPGDLDLPRDLDPSDPEAAGSEGRAWLAKTWARGEVREAVAVSSPDLAARVAQLLASPEQASTRDLRRAVVSLASYLLRWQRRVTPFGLFAGILPAGTGPASAVLGSGYRAVARPAPEWIAGLAGVLERDPALRDQLTVTANALAAIRDGRLVLARREQPAAKTAGPEREASVRWTRPVQAAMQLAAAPVPLGVLADALTTRFRAAPPEAIRELLDGLAAEGFLSTSLQPPLTAENPPGPDAAFSLAGAGRASALLSGAGFGGIEFAKADEPMLLGRDVDDVLKYERTYPSASEVLTGLNPAQAAELTRQVRDRLVAYASPDGVTVPGAAWLVMAQAV